MGRLGQPNPSSPKTSSSLSIAGGCRWAKPSPSDCVNGAHVWMAVCWISVATRRKHAVALQASACVKGQEEDRMLRVWRAAEVWRQDLGLRRPMAPPLPQPSLSLLPPLQATAATFLGFPPRVVGLLPQPTPSSPVYPCINDFRRSLSWVGARSLRGDGMRCQQRRQRVMLPPWRHFHDPDQTSSSSTGGNPKSSILDRAAVVSQRCSLS
jgi:hypothetical protein